MLILLQATTQEEITFLINSAIDILCIILIVVMLFLIFKIGRKVLKIIEQHEMKNF